MNILSKRLEKTKAISPDDKALLLKDAKEHEANGETPIVAAQMAVKFAAEEIQDIYETLVAASELSAPDACAPLDAFWSDEGLVLRNLPKTHIELACAMAEAGIRTPEQLLEVLGVESRVWVEPFAKWISAKYTEGADSGGSLTVDKLSAAVLENLTGVTSEWLSPVRPFFERLAALAMSKQVTDEDFIAALSKAQAQLPEMFDALDTQALEDAFANAMGTAALSGSVS